MPTTPYVHFQAALDRLAQVIAAHPRGKLLRYELGAPTPSFEVDDETPDPPRSVRELARVFDGVTLEWELGRGRGQPSLSGVIDIPTSGELVGNRSHGIWDGGACWVLLPRTTVAHAIVCDGKEDVDLISQASSCWASESHALADVLETMLDAFGLPGWELRLFEPDYGHEVEDLETRLDELDQACAFLRDALKLSDGWASLTRPELDPELAAAYETTDYIVAPQEGASAGFTLHVGALHPELDRFLHARQRPAESWCFITAWNPRSKPQSAQQNDAAQRRLLARLKELGLDALPGVGKHPDTSWSEASLLVPGASRTVALALGRTFAQNAVLFGRAGRRAELLLP